MKTFSTIFLISMLLSFVVESLILVLLDSSIYYLQLNLSDPLFRISIVLFFGILIAIFIGYILFSIYLKEDTCNFFDENYIDILDSKEFDLMINNLDKSSSCYQSNIYKLKEFIRLNYQTKISQELYYDREFLLYDIVGTWWSGFVSLNFLNNLVSQYFIKKHGRKFRRYKEFKKIYNPQ